jgi:dipeptidyl aminopeptidase/acylaminoacyl peptidase
MILRKLTMTASVAVLMVGGIGLTSLLIDPVFAEDMENTFQSKDVFQLEVVGDPQVSPDGKSILYVRNSNDIMTDSTRRNIWIASADGKTNRPFLSGKKSFSSPRWSPNGDRIAYLSNKEGRTQLYVQWVATGETAMLTYFQAGLSGITWSPDGKTIAFTSRVPEMIKKLSTPMPKKPKGAKWADPFKQITKAYYQADGRGFLTPSYSHIFVIPADEGGTPRQLTSGNYHHRGSMSWAPDSSEIIFSANRHDDWEYNRRSTNVFGIKMDGTLRQITDAPGGEYNAKVSKNGKLIAYNKRDNKKLAYRNTYLHVMNIDGSGDKNLSADVDNSLGNLQWNDKSTGIYYQKTVRGVAEVGLVTLKGKHAKIVGGLGSQSLGRPYSSGSYNVSKGTIAFTKGSPTRPADLWVADNKGAKQLTELNEDLLGHKDMGQLTEIIYKSSIDGEEIQGWYLTPPNFDPTKKYPLILEIHGGPHASYGPHFSAEMQRMAAEGYVVFYDNHRGSTSYGERFALLLQGKYSSKWDYADHDSGVNAVIAKGFIEPDQVYITGGSAGGIAAAYAIGLTNRYRAAVVAKPIINWTSKLLTADSGIGQIQSQNPGPVWEGDNLAHMWERSPLSLAGNITTPTMLISGTEDRRTPTSEAVQLYQALKYRKIDTMLVLVPGSPHGIAGKPSRLIGKVEHILAWFNKYK